MKKGDPGSDTWPNANSMRHGGGMTWLPGTYDPELKLYYLGTGNPNPVLTGKGREGDNLWTCSIVALNIDTGKITWCRRRRTTRTIGMRRKLTVLIDGDFNGRPSQAPRPGQPQYGYFFVLDRVTGEHLLTSKMIETMNWSKVSMPKASRSATLRRNPKSMACSFHRPLAAPPAWPPPSFDPETGLFYVGTSERFSVFYLTDTDDHPEGYGAVREKRRRIRPERCLLPSTTKPAGRSGATTGPAGGGGAASMLTTAGKLLFTGDPVGHLVAFDPANGRILWHAGLAASVSNRTRKLICWMVSNMCVVGAGDSLYAFTVMP